jgi:hypothetical protein
LQIFLFGSSPEKVTISVNFCTKPVIHLPASATLADKVNSLFDVGDDDKANNRDSAAGGTSFESRSRNNCADHRCAN